MKSIRGEHLLIFFVVGNSASNKIVSCPHKVCITVGEAEKSQEDLIYAKIMSVF